VTPQGFVAILGLPRHPLGPKHYISNPFSLCLYIHMLQHPRHQPCPQQTNPVPISMPRLIPSSMPHLSHRPTAPHLVVHALSFPVVHGPSQIINSSCPPEPTLDSFPKTGEEQRRLARGKSFLAEEAHLSVQGITKKHRNTKKLLSLDQVSYTRHLVFILP